MTLKLHLLNLAHLIKLLTDYVEQHFAFKKVASIVVLRTSRGFLREMISIHKSIKFFPSFLLLEAQIEEQLYKDIHSPSIWVLHAGASPFSIASIHHIGQIQTSFFFCKISHRTAIQQIWNGKGCVKVKCPMSTFFIPL